jgi:hypothetical protein
MVINSININKTNNHLSSWLTEHKKIKTYDVGNPGPGLGQAHKCGRVLEQQTIYYKNLVAVWQRQDTSYYNPRVNTILNGQKYLVPPPIERSVLKQTCLPQLTLKSSICSSSA